jgi:hypothetical protein
LKLPLWRTGPAASTSLLWRCFVVYCRYLHQISCCKGSPTVSFQFPSLSTALLNPFQHRNASVSIPILCCHWTDGWLAAMNTNYIDRVHMLCIWGPQEHTGFRVTHHDVATPCHTHVSLALPSGNHFIAETTTVHKACTQLETYAYNGSILKILNLQQINFTIINFMYFRILIF